jgi:uncharacterized protein
MSGIAVTNSTCLISLDRIEKLEILRASFEQVLIPPEVLEEFGTEPSWVIVRPVVNTRLIQALRFRVDRGEAAAIALAAETPQAVVVLDDRKARVTAQGLSIPIIGTVGLLLRAKLLGILTEVRPVIDELAVAGFHLSVTLRRKALELASEFDGP